MSATADSIAARLTEDAALDSERLPWDSLWQDLAEVIHPRRALINRKLTTPDTTALARNFDNTAPRSLDILARGCSSRITPMGARWYILRPPRELRNSPRAQNWYAACGEILSDYLYESNFFNRAHEHYKDRGGFGTAATEILPAKSAKGLDFRSFPVGTFSIGHDDRDQVNQLTRTFKWNPGQILAAFGEDTPPRIRKLYDNADTRRVPLELRHSIYPRLDRDPRKSDRLNKPFASCVYDLAEQQLIHESGFDEFPLSVSRWELWGDSAYGWAPAYLALPEATQANFLEEMLDALAEVQAFPRILYAGNLKGEIDFNGMGLTCWDPNLNGLAGAPKEWLTGGRYDIGKDRAADKRRAIEEAFFVPLFNAISQLDRDATATEVRAIVAESRELFHPIFSGLTREFLGPALRRSFNLLLRQGAFPPPPREVLQADLLGPYVGEPAVEYTSAMALALEQSQLSNLADVLAVMAPIAELDPSALDFLETSEIGPSLLRAKGLPAAWNRDPEKIAAIQQARAEAQQAAAAKEAAGAVHQLGGAQGIRDLQRMAS